MPARTVLRQGAGGASAQGAADLLRILAAAVPGVLPILRRMRWCLLPDMVFP
uniref:Uncharacterized protein n=1 Tax=Conchiformibius kuhniae TaxID=211502 RepID=A0A8T9MWL1_9NEIS|nr:hypothetical protein LVJ77_07795 [Conchiformibius kuhniae]